LPAQLLLLQLWRRARREISDGGGGAARSAWRRAVAQIKCIRRLVIAFRAIDFTLQKSLSLTSFGLLGHFLQLHPCVFSTLTTPEA
jgi:hypothetical protein